MKFVVSGTAFEDAVLLRTTVKFVVAGTALEDAVALTAVKFVVA